MDQEWLPNCDREVFARVWKRVMPDQREDCPFEVMEAAQQTLPAVVVPDPPAAEEEGVTFDLTFSEGYPPVVNDEALYAQVARALPDLGRVPEPLLIAEDFAFYQRHLPGVFLLLGTGTGIPLHADTFTFDESVLLAGVAVYQRLLQTA